MSEGAMMTEQELIEQLAEKEHASWARWMQYLFSKCYCDQDCTLIIPVTLVERWRKQADTPYAQLSEREKQSDRDEVAHIMPIIGEHLKQAVIAISNAQVQQGVRLHPNAMLRAIEEAQ
jgi:hypothetical protein